jgi:hypothetical protein
MPKKKLSPEKLAKLNENTQRMIAEGYGEEDIKIMGASFFERFAEEDTTQAPQSQPQPQPQPQQPQPNVAAQAPTPQAQPNIQKVGDKTFDSNTAQILFTDVDGNDILQAVTDDGVEHGIVRKKDGSYDWYRGNIEGDALAKRIKTTATSTSPTLSGRNTDTYRLTTSSGEGSFRNGSENDNAQQIEEIQSDKIKKAAYAVVNKDENIDEVAYEKKSEEEKYALRLKPAQQQGLEEEQGASGQNSIKEYEFRRNAINDQNADIRYTTNAIVGGLQGKYGKRFEDFLNFADTGARQYLDEMDKAKAAKDVNKFNSLLQEYNTQKESYQDIEQDPDFAILGDFNKKLSGNKARVTQLLTQDNFKAARELANYEYARRKGIDFAGQLDKADEDTNWNSGVIGKAKAVASKTGTAVKAIPEILQTSTNKASLGLVTAVKIGTDMLGYNDTGVADPLAALQAQVSNITESTDMASDLSADFKNTNAYSVMTGLADLIPQVALAEITGGVGGLIGKGVGYEAGAASATRKAVLETARQGIASVGFMANDMYEQNMAILDQVEGLSSQEKQRAASRLAFMQSAAVGVGGSLVGGALGAALGKSGILDNQIGRILNMDGISQSEIRAVFQKSANLLKSGALKEYLAATGKDISALLTNKWGSSAADVLKGIAKSGGGKMFKSGTEEGFEEFLFEPITQYTAEQSYKAFGGDVDIDALYAKQDKDEAESREQSGKRDFDDYLSVFMVSAIANGFGTAKNNLLNKQGVQNEMVNQAMLVAMKDMPEFQKQMAKYKESQLAKLDPKSAEYQQKSQALDKIEQDATERIELIRNGGNTNNKSGVSTFDAYSKMTKGQVDGELVSLLGQKADLELEYQALSPSKGESDAIKRDNQESTEQGGGSKTTFTKAQDKKLTEIKAVQSEIDNLVNANSKTLSSRFQNLKNWATKNKEKSPDENIDEQIQDIEQKAQDRVLSTDDLMESEMVQNMSSEERNALQTEFENNPESQVAIAESVKAELESKKIDNQREIANKQGLTNADLNYNTELRTAESSKEKKTDDNNIAFRKDRQYAYATEEQVNAIKETKGKGLKFNKGATKGVKSDYVVERTKDENGNPRTRVYERTDNGFEVIQDEIGDKALLNNTDKRNIENTRYKNASVKAENKREEIISKVANGNRNYLPNEVEAELSKDKEYQRLVKEAQDLAPKSSFWGDVANTVQTIKQSLLPDTTKIDKAVKDKIKELKKKKEIEEVDCIPIAENGIHTNFKGGGVWKIVKKIEGATHEKGGVDIKL